MFSFLLLGWGSSWWQPRSFGWLGNPRGDAYFARGYLILDLTWDDGSRGWHFDSGAGVVLATDEETGLDMDQYRAEARWWKIVWKPLPGLVGGRHLLVGIPALILAHLGLWTAWELAWRRRSLRIGPVARE